MAAEKKKDKAKRYDAARAFLANLMPPHGEGDDYWEKNLELSETHRVLATLRNGFLIFTRDERWEKVLGYDEFANQIVKLEAPPFDGGEPGAWEDIDDLRAAIWFAHHYRVNLKKQTVMEAAIAAANERRFHPVRDYLEGLAWDKRPRLATWLHDYLGADANEYSAAVGRKFLIGAAARVMRPGCKMDNVLILEGPQGQWKSTALKVIAGVWFMDTPFALGDKDAFLALRGKWIIEMAELDAMGRAEASRQKAFFSSSSDTFRAPYQAWARTVARQCVFAGTVNHGTYLRDATGNRRYWPVKVRHAQLDELERDRDQLWAEAFALYNAGVPWWTLPDERKLFELEQEDRYIGDAFEERIEFFLRGRNTVTMGEILESCLELDPSKWTRAEQTRIGENMQALGWVRKRQPSGKRGYYYTRGEREPGEEG